MQTILPSPPPSLGYRISGKEVEVCDSGSQHHPLCHHQGVLSPGYGCPAPGFKSQCQSSSAAPFLTPPTISYTCQRSHILLAVLGCHSTSRQAWPHGMEPIISKLLCRCCNQGELPPSYILGGSPSRPPGSKHSHSYLTYMKPVKGYRHVK